jgi:hypothetical protein
MSAGPRLPAGPKPLLERALDASPISRTRPITLVRACASHLGGSSAQVLRNTVDINKGAQPDMRAVR